MMNIEISERALWDMWQFVRFNKRGIKDACELIAAENNHKHLCYQIDFSDLHSFLFPRRTEAEIESDDLALHGRSVKFLWESILKSDPKQFPFVITLNPGTRLEAMEAFWHAEQRVRRGFERYLPNFSDLFDLSGNLITKDVSALRTAFEKWDYHTFLPRLKKIVSNDTLSHEIRKPAESLIRLFSEGWICNIEDCISSDILEEVMKNKLSMKTIFPELQAFFKKNSRSLELHPEHKEFHDTIDSLNICFCYDLYSCPAASDFYAPLLTHTLRVISAVDHIKQFHGNNQITHLSVSALYYVRARQIKPNSTERFLRTGKDLVEDITEELSQIPSLVTIKGLSIAERTKLMKKESFVVIPKRLYERIKFFAEQYYDIVDIADVLEYEDSTSAQSHYLQDIPKIDDFVELLNRRQRTIEEVRKSAKIVRGKLGYLDGGLAGLYLPKEGRAKTVIDWLGAL